MEISYDKEADAMYIELREGEFARNRKIGDVTIIDPDNKNNILGIELLEVSRGMPAESLEKVQLKNLKATA